MVYSTITTGSFGNKQIPIEIFSSEDSTEVRPLIIFFHGCCGTVFDKTPTTYQLLYEHCRETGAAHCALFESSRNISKADTKAPLDFSLFTSQAFGGKTFSQELLDAKQAVSAIMSYLSEKNITYSILYFVGFSLGGLVALLLAVEFNTQRLFTFGTGASFHVEPNLPILGKGLSQTEKEDIMDAARSFDGEITVIRGSEDDTTDEDAVLDFFSFFSKAQERTVSIWRGVDHRFKKRFAKDDPALVLKIFDTLRIKGK